MGNLRWRDQQTKTLLLSKASFKSEGKLSKEPLHHLERKANLLKKIKEMKSKQNLDIK
ncbi:MAG: hypothetical protein V2A62_02550 [Candidatus Woesearchaeota archaeon]